MLTRALSAVSALTIALLSAHSFAAPPPSDNASEGWVVGGEVTALGASITAPSDRPGEPTLLSGSAFRGPGVRVGFTADAHVAGPLRLGGALGLTHAQMEGYSERGAMRRELKLGFSALELGLRARLTKDHGILRPFGGVGLAGRFGIHAAAKEQRVGFASSEPAPDVKPSTALLLTGELGVRIVRGRVEVPIALDASWNATHGRTTRGRLDGYTNVSLPGTLRVDATWTYGLRVGVGYRF